jgi:hypothetical protein
MSRTVSPPNAHPRLVRAPFALSQAASVRSDLLPGGVELKQLAHQRRPLGGGDGDPGVGAAHVAPRELAA